MNLPYLLADGGRRVSYVTTLSGSKVLCGGLNFDGHSRIALYNRYIPTNYVMNAWIRTCIR